MTIHQVKNSSFYSLKESGRIRTHGKEELQVSFRALGPQKQLPRVKKRYFSPLVVPLGGKTIEPSRGNILPPLCRAVKGKIVIRYRPMLKYYR